MPATHESGRFIENDGPRRLHHNQLIRVLVVFISIRGATFLEESQKEPFQRHSGLIPEAGCHPPESGFRRVTNDDSDAAILWKINKNKGILTGGMRFGMVTKL